MNLIETKGDVSFFKNDKGKLYQKLGAQDIYPVANGKITFRYISTVRGIDIKYQNNGCNGFTLFKGKTILEDNIWEYAKAERIAKELTINDK